MTNFCALLYTQVYKTSILIFKDRDRYVTGEFRFRRGYSKHNPRKMVRVWAEKEMRNLIRLHKVLFIYYYYYYFYISMFVCMGLTPHRVFTFDFFFSYFVLLYSAVLFTFES